MEKCKFNLIFFQKPINYYIGGTMHSHTLQTLIAARGYRPIDLAKKIGVSRQTIFNWLNSKEQNSIRSNLLEKLSKLLKVKMEVLTSPLPCTDEKLNKELMATLLWDLLYPSIEQLVIAAIKWEPQAIARLVQTYGFITTSKILGRGSKKALWDRYPVYKKHIHPAKRSALDNVWENQWNQI
jgi:transcriptional regulator with XRE-family HTH domain